MWLLLRVTMAGMIGAGIAVGLASAATAAPQPAGTAAPGGIAGRCVTAAVAQAAATGGRSTGATTVTFEVLPSGPARCG